MDDLMTPAETAALLRVEVSTLAKWRSNRQGPPYVRLERAVRYSRAAVVAWIERKAVSA